MPSTRPPTNESTRYLNDFPRFVKIVRGFKRKKKGDGTGSRHVGSRVLRESKCMVGREDREASKNNTSLVLNSYGLASAVFSATKRSINKAFFLSHMMYTHCTCRQRKRDMSVALRRKTTQRRNDTHYVQRANDVKPGNTTGNVKCAHSS